MTSKMPVWSPRRQLHRLRAWWRRSARARSQPAASARRPAANELVTAQQITIPADDPLGAYFLANPAPTRIDELLLDSPLLERLRATGVRLVAPLVTQGELVGVFNLGSRRSEQEYSLDDRRLLSNLASQAASAVRIAQLIQEQQAEFRVRERLDQELRVARLIQQTLLPRELPALPDWRLAVYYKPARAVGGDFYDFLTFADGRVGLVIGDVSDKGVPAALVMATTRSILRAAAAAEAAPGKVLAHANELLYPDIPAKMFVTCLYAILDPATGRLRYANAGHNLPYHRHSARVEMEAEALVARGMPLGLMPGMRYEENECMLAPGDSVLLYSDGLVEAHSPAREMFDDPRLQRLVSAYSDEDAPQGSKERQGKQPLIDYLLAQLAVFVGPEWEQEDDITLVTLHRSMGDGLSPIPAAPVRATGALMQAPTQATATSCAAEPAAAHAEWRELVTFSIPSVPGGERQALEPVGAALRAIGTPSDIAERLQTAIAEATMNAMEHGNHFRADLRVEVQLLAGEHAVVARVTDQGGEGGATDGVQPHPALAALGAFETPDLDAKLAQRQSPRGWGMFLIQKLVDQMNVTSDGQRHTVAMTMRLPLESATGRQSPVA